MSTCLDSRWQFLATWQFIFYIYQLFIYLLLRSSRHDFKRMSSFFENRRRTCIGIDRMAALVSMPTSARLPPQKADVPLLHRSINLNLKRSNAHWLVSRLRRLLRRVQRLATSDHWSGMDATLINMPDQENVSEVAQLWNNEKIFKLGHIKWRSSFLDLSLLEHSMVTSWRGWTVPLDDEPRGAHLPWLHLPRIWNCK